MTNGEKFKEVFGFGADGSRVIAVNATWWDCEFQNIKPITKVDQMGVYIKGMEMPKNCFDCPLFVDVYTNTDGDDEYICSLGATLDYYQASEKTKKDCPLVHVTVTDVPIPEHVRLKKRVVYRGDVFNALESARINALDGILTDRYKDGFHDGLKRALEILANEVQDVPTIIPEEEGE